MPAKLFRSISTPLPEPVAGDRLAPRNRCRTETVLGLVADGHLRPVVDRCCRSPRRPGAPSARAAPPVRKGRARALSARVVVCGAGALGSVYAGLLFEAGEDVLLLGCSPHALSVRERGLELRLPGRTLRVHVPVAERGKGELVLLAAKSFGTGEALARVTGKPRVALSLQNGPRKNEELLARFGPATGPWGCMHRGRRAAGGGRRREQLTRAHVRRRAPRACRRARRGVVALLERAGLPAAAADDVHAVEWLKLAQVAAVMGAQAQTRSYVHEILLAAEGQRLLRELSCSRSRRSQPRRAHVWRICPACCPCGRSLRQTNALHSCCYRSGGVRSSQRDACRSGPHCSEASTPESGRRPTRFTVPCSSSARARGVPAPGLEVCYEAARSF